MVFSAVILLGSSYSIWALRQPLPVLQPVNVLSTLPKGSAVALTWPGYGQAAVGASGYGMLANNGKQSPAPTASVAKVMTALAVLQKKPLAIGQQGPSLTIGSQDIAFYNQYVAQGGSVVPVNYGEQLSEYQALQAMLLPSANNMADTLASWAFGSVQAYLDYAKGYTAQLKLQSSNFADASGFSAATTSTASDLVLLGEAALANPVIAQIVGQSQADVPVAGTIHNVNGQLGMDGINGIKTGNTDQAGGVYLVSGTYTLAGKHSVTIVAVIMGAPSLGRAMQDSLGLLASSQKGFAENVVVHKGEVVGYYNTSWQTSANAVAGFDLTSFGWKGSMPKLSLSLRPVQPPINASHPVGTLTLTSGSTTQKTNVTIQNPLPGPTWQWRLLHP